VPVRCRRCKHIGVLRLSTALAPNLTPSDVQQPRTLPRALSQRESGYERKERDAYQKPAWVTLAVIFYTERNEGWPWRGERPSDTPDRSWERPSLAMASRYWAGVIVISMATKAPLECVFTAEL
jgi:hypothetical protein